MKLTNQEKQAGVPHRIRLKIRTGQALSTEEEMLKFSVAGRDVTLRSARNQQRPSDASWLLMDSEGFATEDEARKFGEHLRRTADLVGVCTRIGLDGRGPSDDRRTSWFNEEWLRSEGVVKEGQRVGPDIHGLVVIPDDREIVWLSAGPASGRVTSDPNRFVRAMEEAAPGGESLSIQQAIRVLNLAQINGDPLAKVVLSISSIEALAETDQEWTDQQRDIKAALRTWLESQYGDQDGAKEISDAIERLHRRSIRQQLKKLLQQNELEDELWRDLDRLYDRRSRLFHGGGGLDEPGLSKLGAHATTLCSRIVLSLAKRQGAVLPSVAKDHFPIE